MGTYCTTTSLATLMIGTTFDSATTALATKCITWAENECNKFLSERYNIGNWSTSTAVPPLVTDLCEQISEGFMYIQMSRGGKESISRGEKMIAEAKENLEMLRKKRANLLDTSGSVIAELESSTEQVVKSNTKDYSTTFDEDDPLHWAVDQDKLDDIDDARD